MILHTVLLQLSQAYDAKELQAIMGKLSDLSVQMDGFDMFEHGPNIDLEQKSPDYAYGFLCAFRDRAALEAYAADPRHAALGERLVALCEGGGDGIMVYDLDTGN